MKTWIPQAAGIFIGWFTLIAIGRGVDPGSVDSESWVKAPLTFKKQDGSVAEVPKETLEQMPAGFPALHRLSIKREPEEKERWIVSAITVSTNAGGPRSEVPIYIRYEDGQWELAALSNLKGEVLFRVSPRPLHSGKTAKPAHLYVGMRVGTADDPGPGSLRQYPFAVTR